MSWHGEKIFDETEVKVGSCEIPSHLQVGAEATLGIQLDEEGLHIEQIPCRIAGVNIGYYHKVEYDLAFEVAKGYWVKVCGFRGWVSPLGEATDTNGGLIGADELKSDIDDYLKSQKPKLSIVPSVNGGDA